MPDPRKLLVIALRHHQQGNLDEAEWDYREVLKTDRTNANALHLLGMVHHERGQNDEAARLVRQAIEQRPNEGALHNSLGVVQLGLGQYADAKATLEHALALGPATAEMYDNLGVALRHLGMLDQAEECFEEAIRRNANYAGAPLHLGQLAAQRDESWKAETCFRQTLAVDPEISEAYVDLAKLLAEQKRWDEAVMVLRNGADRLPENAEIQFHLGVTVADQGNYTAAAEYLGRSLAIQPNSPIAHDRLGAVLLTLDDSTAALDHFREAVRLEPNTSCYQVRTAAALRELGQTDEAVEILQGVLNTEPDSLEALVELGKTEQALQNFEGAQKRFEHVLQLQPNNGDALFGLANVFERIGEPERVVEHCVHALKSDPQFAPAHLLLGLVLSWRLAPEHRAKMDLVERDELSDKALDHMKKAVALKTFADTLAALGNVMIRVGHHDEAIQTLQQAISLSANYAPAYQDLGKAHLELGDVDEARGHFRKAISLDQRMMEAQYELSRIARVDDPKAEIYRLESLTRDSSLAGRDRMLAHFTLGRWFDQLGDFDSAFQHYQTANGLKDELPDNRRKRKGRESRSPDEEGTIERQMAVFDRAHFESRKGWGSPSELPVFIVGMPRSGTTLVEQIVSAHPQVHGAGELMDISDLALSLARRLQSEERYPEVGRDITEEMAAKLAEEYLGQLRRRDPSAIRITDKMPTNFRHLGLIALLMPKARVLHVIRDPMDVGVSCLKQNLEWPFCDLEAVGRCYRSYERLMRHWKSVLPLSICDVHYEQLVTDQEDQSRRMIEFCGLEWDDCCLDFASSDRAVQTPSKWQVRQPIYRSSVCAWKKYEAHLGPLKRALGLDDDQISTETDATDRSPAS